MLRRGWPQQISKQRRNLTRFYRGSSVLYSEWMLSRTSSSSILRDLSPILRGKIPICILSLRCKMKFRWWNMQKFIRYLAINKIIIKNSLPLNYKIYYKFELFSIIILSWRKNFSRLHIYIIPSKLIDRYRWISKARIISYY